MYMLLEEGDKINFETDEYFSFSPAGGWHKIERIMKYNVNPVTWLVRRKISQDNIERNDSAAGIPKVSLPDGEHNKSSFQFPKEVEAFNDIGIQHWMGRPEDNESIGAHKMYLYFSRKLNT